jgi:YD repeat-containing protein
VTIRSTAVVFMLGVLLWAGSVGAAAQNRSCKAYPACAIYSLYDARCIPQLPKTAYDCFTNGPFSAQCTVNTNGCAPPPESCTATPPGQPSSPICGAPINLANGNTSIAQTDVKIPGLGGGLTLVRTWNSVWPSMEGGISSVGMFGSNWHSNFEESVFAGGDGYLKYARGDGGFWSFGWTGQTDNTNSFGLAGPANLSATLLQTTGNWTLSLQNGEQRVFDGTSGNLLSITDRNGNTTQLTYDASYRLITVTDPAARHLYFSYATPTSFLVTSVTSDVGLSLSYSYDNQGRLIQYTKPDLTTVSFQYNGPNPTLITAVLDSNGKVLESHTYDNQGRGLTSSRAGGVESVTITYPPSVLGALPN